MKDIFQNYLMSKDLLIYSMNLLLLILMLLLKLLMLSLYRLKKGRMRRLDHWCNWSWLILRRWATHFLSFSLIN